MYYSKTMLMIIIIMKLFLRNDLLTEGAASNVFIVEDDKVITPKLSENLLSGVTRDLIINLASER